MMAIQLPPGYVEVANALATRGTVNVIGVVVDIWGGAFRSQGTSTCITFTIKDYNLNNGHTWDGLKVRYFTESETMLPPVQQGDVVLLRNLWVKVITGTPQGVAAQNRIIPWAIFRPDRDPTSHLSALTGPVPFEPTYKEESCALTLLKTAPTSFRSATISRPNFAQVSASKSTSSTQQKFSLLKDIEDRQFVDLIGEIVKIHSNDSEKATLYLTDYTENENLFFYASDNDDDPAHGREGDEYNYIKRPPKKWNGPSGRMTVQITLWEPHASFLRNHFNENEVVRLKNVRIKGSRVEGGTLEGVIHTNRDNPSATNVFPINHSNDTRAQELLSRKTEYLKAHPERQKRKSDKDAEQVSKKSNTKKKRVKAQPKPESGQATLSASKRTVVNEYVKPRVPPSVPSQTLEDIINNPSHINPSPSGIKYRLPFQNFCYLSTVRVVDFYPPLLEDFAVQEERASLAYDKRRDPATSRTYPQWEWRFCLLVESISPTTGRQPKERIKLFVSNSEAEHLLNMRASNLRQDLDGLRQLREKLFVLWGDLEEKKRTVIEEGKSPLDLGPISSRPFNCCLMEYGIRCSHSGGSSNAGDNANFVGCTNQDCYGWERRFGLLTTTIHG